MLHLASRIGNALAVEMLLNFKACVHAASKVSQKDMTFLNEMQF